ncbi:MAG: peptidylprolyl isomerase [Flavobacteriaceae bacterium]|nr:peptidylprolyl isomerase [Flavobacteriaceae bacterium]
MKFQINITLLTLCVCFNGFAQISKADVLFTVDKTPVYASEFVRVYNKNLDLVKDESQKDVDEYLKLFVNYKLKLAEARALGIDKKPNYLREFGNYKKELTKNYLTDHEVTEELVAEAYERLNYDIKARHVLVRVDEHVKDTTASYAKIIDYKNRYLTDGFEKLQASVHDGKTVFVEDLGYFSAFKMVYDFETVAYNTPVGQFSKPFRTRFGYHVIEVLDRRKSRGEISVGHIMITNVQKDSLVIPEIRIHEINKMLEQGEPFESLAKQFSDDTNSAKNGGKLSTFKSGQLSSTTFEDMAFGIQEVGNVTPPFQTEYGWHIVKLYEKIPVASFDVLQYDLESKVKQDSRSKLINSAMTDKLKLKYNVSAENTELEAFVGILDSTYFKHTWQIPEEFNLEAPLVKIETKTLTYGDFARFLRNSQRSFSRPIEFQTLVDQQYESFLDTRLIAYYEANLELENEEFGHVLNEYRDGLLLFDLMETHVWNAVKEDTLALKKYYNTNQSHYFWEDRVDAVVATCTSPNVAERVMTMFKQNIEIEALNLELNKENQQNVIFTSGLMDAQHRALPENFELKTGVFGIEQYNDAYHVIKVIKVHPKTQKTFDEAIGNVTSEFQKAYEHKWLEDLSMKYKVEINTVVLDKVKSVLKN